MGGIGFLGAGAIIKSGVTVRGLTTAASLWCIAAIGMACGMALYMLAVFTAVLVLFSLLGLHFIEHRMQGHWYKTIHVTCDDRPEAPESIARLLRENGVHVLDASFDRDVKEHKTVVTYDVRFRDRAQTQQIYRVLSGHPGLLSVRIE